MNGNTMTEAEMERRYARLARGRVQPISDSFRDKCKGAIMGTIVGDALFQPIEFSSKLGHPWIDKMTYGKVWGIPAGCYTDDSSMMLCIMQGFLDGPRYINTIHNIAKAFVRWMDEGLWSATGNCFDIGNSCRSGLMAFKRNGSLVNGTPYSIGCGGIMRYASSWMVGYNLAENHFKEGRLEIVQAINNIDHANETCQAAIRRITSIYDDHLLKKRKTSLSSEYSNWRDATGGGDAYGCLETALWAFNTTNNFKDAVIASGNVGGDTDSVAAVCGGIAGSYYGFKAIPQEWLEALPEYDRLNNFVEEFLDATVEE